MPSHPSSDATVPIFEDGVEITVFAAVVIEAAPMKTELLEKVIRDLCEDGRLVGFRIKCRPNFLRHGIQFPAVSIDVEIGIGQFGDEQSGMKEVDLVFGAIGDQCCHFGADLSAVEFQSPIAQFRRLAVENRARRGAPPSELELQRVALWAAIPKPEDALAPLRRAAWALRGLADRPPSLEVGA